MSISCFVIKGTRLRNRGPNTCLHRGANHTHTYTHGFYCQQPTTHAQNIGNKYVHLKSFFFFEFLNLLKLIRTLDFFSSSL